MRLVRLTGLQGQKYWVNVERISLEEAENYMLPGYYAPMWDGLTGQWTVVSEEGKPDRFVKESAEDILIAAGAKKK